MVSAHVREWALVGGLVATMWGTASAQEPAKLSDQLIDQLATGLARVADSATPRAVAYFTAEPTPQIRAYLEGQGVEVVVTGGVAGAPATAGPPVMAAAPAAPLPATAPVPAPPAPGAPLMGVRVPESKKLIQDFLTGVRDLAASLPPGSPVTIDAFSVDLPGGSVQFRLR